MKLKTHDTIFDCDNCLQSYCKKCFEYAHDDSCEENKKKLREEEEFEESYKKEKLHNPASCPYCLTSSSIKKGITG